MAGLGPVIHDDFELRPPSLEIGPEGHDIEIDVKLQPKKIETIKEEETKVAGGTQVKGSYKVTAEDGRVFAVTVTYIKEKLTASLGQGADLNRLSEKIAEAVQPKVAQLSGQTLVAKFDHESKLHYSLVTGGNRLGFLSNEITESITQVFQQAFPHLQNASLDLLRKRSVNSAARLSPPPEQAQGVQAAGSVRSGPLEPGQVIEGKIVPGPPLDEAFGPAPLPPDEASQEQVETPELTRAVQESLDAYRKHVIDDDKEEEDYPDEENFTVREDISRLSKDEFDRLMDKRLGDDKDGMYLGGENLGATPSELEVSLKKPVRSIRAIEDEMQEVQQQLRAPRNDLKGDDLSDLQKQLQSLQTERTQAMREEVDARRKTPPENFRA